MTTSITFRGGETTGGVSDRRIETAKNETTGGVGARKNQESIFNVDNELKEDTVCFRGRDGEEKSSSKTGLILGTTAGITLATIGLLGIAHKKNWFSFKNSDKITEPCYKACKWVKNNCYDKVAKWFKSSK